MVGGSNPPRGASRGSSVVEQPPQGVIPRQCLAHRLFCGPNHPGLSLEKTIPRVTNLSAVRRHRQPWHDGPGGLRHGRAGSVCRFCPPLSGRFKSATEVAATSRAGAQVSARLPFFESRWPSSAGSGLQHHTGGCDSPTGLHRAEVLRDTRRSSKPEYRARYPDARPFSRRESGWQPGLHRPGCGGSTPPSRRVRAANFDSEVPALNR